MMIGILLPEGICLNEVVWQFHVKQLPSGVNTNCCTKINMNKKLPVVNGKFYQSL